MFLNAEQDLTVDNLQLAMQLILVYIERLSKNRCSSLKLQHEVH